MRGRGAGRAGPAQRLLPGGPCRRELAGPRPSAGSGRLGLARTKGPPPCRGPAGGKACEGPRYRPQAGPGVPGELRLLPQHLSRGRGLPRRRTSWLLPRCARGRAVSAGGGPFSLQRPPEAGAAETCPLRSREPGDRARTFTFCPSERHLQGSRASPVSLRSLLFSRNPLPVHSPVGSMGKQTKFCTYNRVK